jgi:dihydrofolate reductase
MAEVNIIAAFDQNRVIGNDGKIPWDVPEEQQHFKETTMGYPIIMGRKTYENVGNLEGREIVVLSEEQVYSDATAARSIESALAYCQYEYDQDKVFIAGGESVYEQTLDIADKMVISIIDGTYDGDSYFPQFDLSNWEFQSRKMKNDFSIIEYKKNDKSRTPLL